MENKVNFYLEVILFVIIINIMGYIINPYLIPHLLVTCEGVVNLESGWIHWAFLMLTQNTFLSGS